MSEKIIADIWSPLVSEQKGTSVKIDCFGRTYTMKGSLPESIISGGKEVMASPARYRATFRGKEACELLENTFVSEQNEDCLVYHNQATIGNVILDSRVNVERDGLIWVDLMVFPYTQSGMMDVSLEEGVPQLDSLILELPVRREIAELYHYWPVVDGSGLSNSGSLPDEGIALPFRPHLWIGTEKAGLSFYVESNQYWQSADADRVFSFRMTDDAAVLVVHLLDSMPAAWIGHNVDDWNAALEPLSFSFGLQASPVKPYHSAGDYRNNCHKALACSDPEHPYDLDAFEKEADELVGLGVKWRTFHEDWSMIQNYGLPMDVPMFKAKVDALHKRGIKAMVYFGYEYSSLVPNFFDNYRKALVRHADGTLRGGWQRQPAQRAYITCYAGNYSETMLERCRKVMDEYGVDGIYTDGTYCPWDCANAEHGCGWTDTDGVRHTTWPLRKVREHCKKLFIQTHERGGIVEAHQSSCVIPMILAYSDCYWDGEHIALTTDPATGKYRSLTGKELIEKYTGESGAGIGTMRAEFTGVNFGIACQFLSYAPTFDECSGLTILYGILPKPGGGLNSIRQASRHWRIMDEYGLTEDRFIPFWRNDCPIKCLDSRISCSVWDTPSGLAAVFVNLTGEPAETEFTCDRTYTEAVDLQNGAVLPAKRVAVDGSTPIYVLLKK